MVIAHSLVPAVALSGTGAALLFLPAFSSSIPTVFSLPLFVFWLFSWSSDARFTAKHWRLILEGCEANVFVLALSRLAPCKPVVVFVAHAAFCIGAATGLQALITHAFDHFLMSSILAVFGLLHLDALCRSREFVMMMEPNPAEKKMFGGE